jgi:hypothetical protein
MAYQAKYARDVPRSVVNASHRDDCDLSANHNGEFCCGKINRVSPLISFKQGMTF